MGTGCAPPPPDAGGAGAGCVPPPDGAAVGCAAAGVGCGARVGAAPDEPPDGAVGCAVGCAPPCPMNGRLPQPLSRRAPMIRTVDGKSRALNETSLHDDTFLHQQTWRLSQTPCKRTMVERRIEHRIVRNDHLLQRWRMGSGGSTDVLRVFYPCGSREEGNTHNLQEFSQGLNLVDEVEHSRNRAPRGNRNSFRSTREVRRNLQQFSQRLNQLDRVERSQNRAPDTVTEMNVGLRKKYAEMYFGIASFSQKSG
jgi:hypothetical protein